MVIAGEQKSVFAQTHGYCWWIEKKSLVRQIEANSIDRAGTAASGLLLATGIKHKTTHLTSPQTLQPWVKIKASKNMYFYSPHQKLQSQIWKILEL